MSMENNTTKDVHISQITVGDTVHHDGQMRTVNNNHIGFNSFTGKTLFGDSYRLGTKLVKKYTSLRF